MIILTNAGTDKLQLVTSVAATFDVLASWTDLASNGSGDPTPGRTGTAITTATTTDIVATPGASTVRNLKELTVRNKHASLPCDVTVIYNANGTQYELYKTSISPGETLEYIEGIGWFELQPSVTPFVTNYSVTAQVISTTASTLIDGSQIVIPVSKMKIGTMFRWRFDMTKTAAGTATSAFAIKVGTSGTVSDAAICSFTKPAGTAVVDCAMVNIAATVRGPLSASCIMAGAFHMNHNLSATGHAVIPCVDVVTVSSGFDATTAGLIVTLSVALGTSDNITIQSISSEGINL
jgi:hypothetical protein